MQVYGRSGSRKDLLPLSCILHRSTFRRFFNSWFHCFDAIVIIAGFVIDVCLKGVLEEVGSMVVVLRLWRVFKIIEEFSAGASEQMETMSEIIENLEVENKDLKRRLKDATGEEQ